MQQLTIRLFKLSAPRNRFFAAADKSGKQHGMTLVDAMIVLALIGIVAGMAAPLLQALQESRRIEGHAVALATDIQYVRSEAVACNRKMHISFGADARGSCYVLYSGNEGDCSCTSAGQARCSGGSAATKTVGLAAGLGVRLQANTPSMLFDPARGTVTPTGSFDLMGDSGRALRHIINIAGRTRTCSPQGSMAGYKAC